MFPFIFSVITAAALHRERPIVKYFSESRRLNFMSFKICHSEKLFIFISISSNWVFVYMTELFKISQIDMDMDQCFANTYKRLYSIAVNVDER